MIKRIILILLLVQLLLSYACLQQNSNIKKKKETDYPSINWPELGSNNSIDIDITIDNNMYLSSFGTEINIYKVIKPDIDNIISYLNKKFQPVSQWTYLNDRVFISDENEIIEIDTNTGYWFYEDRVGYYNLYNNIDNAVITSDNAAEIAKNVARDHNVDLELFSDIRIGKIEYALAPNEDVSDNNSVLLGYEVFFYPVIDGNSVWGIDQFNVTIDGRGEVVAINKRFPDISFYSKEICIPPIDAIKDIVGNQGHMMSEIPINAQSAIIQNYYMVYYIDVESLDSDYYCQPVYVFKGIFISEDGEVIDNNSFTAMTSAI